MPNIVVNCTRAIEKLDNLKSGVNLSFANQIDNVIARLLGKERIILESTGEYKIVKGHHPLAKTAFKDNFSTETLFKQYYDEAFSVGIKQLEKVGGKGIHGKITGQQNSLYTRWKKDNIGKTMTIEDMAQIEIKAMTNVGIPEDIATGWVIKALEKLKQQGIGKVSNIPWNGINP